MHWKARHLSQSDARQIFSTIRLYREVDKTVGRFCQTTGIRCIPSCGRCCQTSNVDSTILEVMPLAFRIWIDGRLDEVLSRLAADNDDVCIFYMPAGSDSGKGSCSVYSLRPLMCRLFGFSARIDKNGVPQLITCTHIKQRYPANYRKALDHLAAGREFPVMSDFAMRLSALGLDAGGRRLPINVAVRQALERIGFITRLKTGRNHAPIHPALT
jgi:Fe-S-cluster containining protein